MLRIDSVSDLAFFSLLIQQGTLAATAQQLGVSPPAVSKRLQAIERRLGVRLLNRTTRRISLTPEGEAYHAGSTRVLADLEELERTVTGGRETPRGLLRISATLGFGRTYIAPALSRFVSANPEVEVQLHLSDRPVNLVEQGFDLVVRFGELPEARLVARRLASNRRVLCASPTYLQARGVPSLPRELAQHQCIFIREADETFGTWHLSNGVRQETVKVRGLLSSNDGESAMAWALDGHGILMRSQWAAAPLLGSGKLKLVLPDWHAPSADIYLVFPARGLLSAKTRALVDFLLHAFKDRLDRSDSSGGGW